MILQGLQFIQFCVWKMILYQIVVRMSKRLFFYDVVHFIDEENMMTYVDFDCAFTFFPETPTKVRQIIFLNPYNLWDMVPATLMSLNRTNFTYSMFNQCPQPTTQQPRRDSYPVFSSLRTMDSKKKGLRVSFAFFQITYRTDEWTKQLLRLKTWVISGSPEQWMEFHRLWSTVIVFKCSYLFQLFDFYCLMVRYLLFSENLLFSFLWWLWVRSKSSLTISMYGNTPLGSRSRNLS